MSWRILLTAAPALIAVLLCVAATADEPLLSPRYRAEGVFVEPDAVFVSQDPPVAPPVALEEPNREDMTDPVDIGELLDRIEALEERNQSQSHLLDSLESRLAKQQAQEEARREADSKRPTVRWTAQLQADTYWFNQDSASEATFGNIRNGEAFRRARFGILGDYGPTEYRIEMDFALSTRPSFVDVFAGVNDLPVLGRLRIGHYFEPFTLDRLTANRFVTFMERSLIDQAFAPARNMGIMANNTVFDERGTWALGVFRSDSDPFGDDVGDNFESAVTGRITFLPYYDESSDGRNYIHVGAGYSFRGANGERVRFRAQPEARIGAADPNVPFFVDTGNIPADAFQLAGLEAAWGYGPLSMQTEYVLAPVDAHLGPTLYFSGWYATVSYFLTGEHRPYRRDNGTFDRVRPRTEAVRYDANKEIAFGPGAWEIAVRVSQLDLNDLAVRGGELTDVTVGLNWYLNPYLRFTSNYIRAMADHPTGGRSDTDIFGVRIGYDF